MSKKLSLKRDRHITGFSVFSIITYHNPHLVGMLNRKWQEQVYHLEFDVGEKGNGNTKSWEATNSYKQTKWKIQLFFHLHMTMFNENLGIVCPPLWNISVTTETLIVSWWWRCASKRLSTVNTRSNIIPSSVFTVHSINDEGDINKAVRLSH